MELESILSELKKKNEDPHYKDPQIWVLHMARNGLQDFCTGNS